MKTKVAVQKGKIVSDRPTSKQMTYREKVSERSDQLRMLKDNQTPRLKTPKN
jgi:hypothetical protein